MRMRTSLRRGLGYGLALALIAPMGACQKYTGRRSTSPPAHSAISVATNPLAGCTMCHTDVENEFVGSVHFKMNIGCTRCHGPSEGHLADENNEVKPDELFARKDVDRLCGICHECRRPKETKAPPPAEPEVCIDCHGAHTVALVKNDRARTAP